MFQLICKRLSVVKGVVYDDTRKHAINKTIHQTLPKD
jgi:hypothetical protein